MVEKREQAKARAKAGDDAPGPTEIRTQLVRTELAKASVWFGLALLVGACIILVQPILLIFAGIVMASMLDGGTRLLGRILPIGRGWRLLIVCLAIIAFRSEEHTSELQSIMRISYAVFCLKKKNQQKKQRHTNQLQQHNKPK